MSRILTPGVVLLLVYSAARAVGQPADSAPDAVIVTPEGEYAPPDVTGWEGFFSLETLDDLWLEARGLPFGAAPIQGVKDRVGRLVMDDGPSEAQAADLELMFERYCTDPQVRAWNEDRCIALEARACEGDTCSYRHFGSCSGLVYDRTTFLTAAHCVDGMRDDPTRRPTSAILLPDPDGSPPRRLAIGEVRAGKDDFDHHWVALDDADPVDVAAVAIDASEELVTYPIAPLPGVGEPVFVVGYPRVEGRDPAAAEAAGYTLNFGTRTVSFGRLADANADDLPLCNVDGMQEHWALTRPCKQGPTAVDSFDTWTGVITHAPFLTTFDSCNGYSGAPIFDARGALIGVNVTLVSDTNPQDRFVPHARMVGIDIDSAMDALGMGALPEPVPLPPAPIENPDAVGLSADSPAPHLALDRLVIRGGLDRERIRRALETNLDALNACCKELPRGSFHKDDEPLDLLVRFVIGQDGRASHVVPLEDDLGNKAFTTCITRILRQTRFHNGGTALVMVDMPVTVGP